jgi:hypothetical protein
MFLPQTPRADPQPREAGELGEEPYDKVARHHHELSPRTCGSIHEINHNTHLLTPRLEGGISSMISCAVSPAADKIDTEEMAKATLQYVAYDLLPQRAAKEKEVKAAAAAVPPATPPAPPPPADLEAVAGRRTRGVRRAL